MPSLTLKETTLYEFWCCTLCLVIAQPYSGLGIKSRGVPKIKLHVIVQTGSQHSWSFFFYFFLILWTIHIPHFKTTITVHFCFLKSPHVLKQWCSCFRSNRKWENEIESCKLKADKFTFIIFSEIYFLLFLNHHRGHQYLQILLLNRNCAGSNSKVGKSI